ncbi:protein FAR1-RELATED SEQUENCE 6-like [Lotus japonicus]|uniref:protein FAR1-RELATED SEQUENCE 6-like n=1 Tax=Lotus japonicus TaxID=34305 RepID=UPI00258BB9A8|nr:protein FAR1-RELATED SEQUENCE 6-like [Lotus japonicus]XP_057438089.1 protein FAR1-RELATED SEQUENCE 6-like [Lotus japonicus]XP_057438090.1 protein FAR1-RELATED SEQUENCE 6-like [Lotus japonicus]XP_057438091.1 protein FAR1-RELATED SEQUENCE 6-like [Lotus japonicus]
MGDDCDTDSHAPLDNNSSGCQETLTPLLLAECKAEVLPFDENDDLHVPQPGMIFSSEDEVRSYYKEFASQLGFRVMTRTSRKGRDGRVKYLILQCSGSGGSNKGGISTYMKPNCEAKITVTLNKDGTCRVNTVTLSHNHELSSHGILKNIDMRSKKISGQKNVDVCVKRTSSQSDCRNYTKKRRHLLGENGDSEALQKYFGRMQKQDSNFFYTVDIDDFFSVRNVFWADGRSRAAYESFGDVLTVDTAYLFNQYKMPLVTFVGVNHHGQSVLFGCALLSSEDLESFVWLFQSLLHCMSGVPPQGIITNHCEAMQKAIETVLPSTRHRWCLSYIMKKLPQKLQRYPQYESIKHHLQNVVYDAVSTDEFERNWMKIVEDFGLEDNEWLNELFLERHHWVPSFVRSSFWAGMSVNLLNESMHAFFDGYVNQHTTLKQFVDQYDNTLQYKAEQEYVADVHSSCSTKACITQSLIERQFQSAYTNAKFQEVQDEFVGKADCNVSVDRVDGSICHYNVVEDVIIGDMPREYVVEVTYNRVTCDVKCDCRLFDFRGILCRHSLAILSQERVKEVPGSYVLDRWRKNLRRKYVYVKTSYCVQHLKPQMQRLESLCNQFISVAEAAAESEETTSFVKVTLCNFKEKLEAWAPHLTNSSQVDIEEAQCISSSYGAGDALT